MSAMGSLFGFVTTIFGATTDKRLPFEQFRSSNSEGTVNRIDELVVYQTAKKLNPVHRFERRAVWSRLVNLNCGTFETLRRVVARVTQVSSFGQIELPTQFYSRGLQFQLQVLPNKLEHTLGQSTK